MKNNKNRIALIFVLIVFVLILIARNKKSREVRLLVKSFEIVNGSIDQLGFQGGGSVITPSYKYIVNNKVYNGSYSFNLYCKEYSSQQLSVLLTKKIPVVYNPIDPTISQILLKERDFQKYGQNYSSEYRTLLRKYFDCHE